MGENKPGMSLSYLLNNEDFYKKFPAARFLNVYVYVFFILI